MLWVPSWSLASIKMEKIGTLGVESSLTVFIFWIESAFGGHPPQTSITSVRARFCHSGCRLSKNRHQAAVMAVVSWPAMSMVLQLSTTKSSIFLPSPALWSIACNRPLSVALPSPLPSLTNLRTKERTSLLSLQTFLLRLVGRYLTPRNQQKI